MSLILCILVLTSVACLSVSAKVTYPVGDWVYEKINDNNEFEIDEYVGSSTTLMTAYTHNLLPITSVGANAFMDNDTLVTITLSKNITAVQSYAFQNCTALTNVYFKNNVVTLIDNGAFSGCSSLTNIALEDTYINKVAHSTFMNCSSLEEITLPETVTTIENYAFAQCDSLTKVVVPATVTEISDSAFYGSENVVIYCYKDSAAHTYAEAKAIDYVLLDDVEMFILGDTDGDGDVTILDAAFVQLIVAQKKQDTDGRMSIRGDIDRDGLLSVMDATEIQFYLADTNPNENIGKEFPY